MKGYKRAHNTLFLSVVCVCGEGGKEEGEGGTKGHNHRGLGRSRKTTEGETAAQKKKEKQPYTREVPLRDQATTKENGGKQGQSPAGMRPTTKLALS